MCQGGKGGRLEKLLSGPKLQGMALKGRINVSNKNKNYHLHI